jgi:hypothetical protein
VRVPGGGGGGAACHVSTPLLHIIIIVLVLNDRHAASAIQIQPAAFAGAHKLCSSHHHMYVPAPDIIQDDGWEPVMLV